MKPDTNHFDLASSTLSQPSLQDVYEATHHEFCYTRDVRTRRREISTDGLPQEHHLIANWSEQRVFVPLLGVRDPDNWINKACTESWENRALIVCLAPARFDSAWWHTFRPRATEIRFPITPVRPVNADYSGGLTVMLIFRPRS
jgi:hypothetical protein